MINPKELRKGNLIWDRLSRLNPEDYDDIIVLSINGDDDSIINEIGNEYKADELFGIPLTPDWLDKFEFRKFADDSYHKPAMLTWRVLYDDFEKAASYCTCIYPELGHRVYLPIRIEYVHQLQNIYFIITGEELEIEL